MSNRDVWYTVGTNGQIRKKINGRWTALTSPTSDDLRCIHGIDRNTIWIGSDDSNPGQIWFSDDGGANWDSQYTAASGYRVKSLWMQTINLGWAVLKHNVSGQILLKWDGTSWASVDTTMEYYPISVYGDDIILGASGAAATNAQIRYSTDGGDSFSNGSDDNNLQTTGVFIQGGKYYYAEYLAAGGDIYENTTLAGAFSSVFTFDADYGPDTVAAVNTLWVKNKDIIISGYHNGANAHKVWCHWNGSSQSWKTQSDDVNQPWGVSATNIKLAMDSNLVAEYTGSGSATETNIKCGSTSADYKGIWGYDPPVVPDLRTAVGKQRNIFACIDGLEKLLWEYTTVGQINSSSHTVLTCLTSPSEVSSSLATDEYIAGVSSITIELTDVDDPDNEGESFFGKEFATAAWETANNARLDSTTGTLDADATTIICIDTTDMPSSGDGYIGQERVSWTGKTATALTGVTRGLYPCVRGANAARTHVIPIENEGGAVPYISEKRFTYYGALICIYVTTGDGTDWHPHEDAEIIWCGRISGISYDGARAKWLITANHIIADLERKVANLPPKTTLAPIVNLSGSSDEARRIIGEELTLEGEIVSKLDANLGGGNRGIYTTPGVGEVTYPKLNDLLSQINNLLFYSNWDDSDYTGSSTIFDCHFENRNGFAVLVGYSSAARKLRLTSKRALQALGFDIKAGEFIELNISDELSANNLYYGELEAPDKMFAGYHPITHEDNAKKLFVEGHSLFSADQGDRNGKTDAWASIDGVELEGKEGNYYICYDAKNTNIGGTLTLDLNVKDYLIHSSQPKGLIGYRVESEPTRITQALVPHMIDSNGDKIGPYEVILRVLTSTGVTDNNGDYDIYPHYFGLGIPVELIDTDSFIEADKAILANPLSERAFFPIQNETIRALIEMECSLWGFVMTWEKGKLTMKRWPPDPVDTQVTFDADRDMNPFPLGFGYEKTEVVNQFTVSTGYDHFSEQFVGRPLIITDDISILNLSTTVEKKIEHKGVSRHDIGIIKNLLDATLLGRLNRYPLPVLDVIFPPTWIEQVFVGDCIVFDSGKFPDPYGDGSRTTLCYAAVLEVGWPYHPPWMGRGRIALLTQFQNFDLPWGPAAIVDQSETNGGLDAVNDWLTLLPHGYGDSSTDNEDGEVFKEDHEVLIYARAPSDPSSTTAYGPYTVASDYETDGANRLTLEAGAGAAINATWDSDIEHVVVFADRDDSIASDQITGSIFLADDDTGKVNGGSNNGDRWR